MKFSGLSNKIIGCAIEVHKNLGAGLLESTYEQCFAYELKLNGLEVMWLKDGLKSFILKEKQQS